jgi:hypothetical protein
LIYKENLQILFNLYRHRYYPNLYGGLQRKYFTPGLIFIFDHNVNTEGKKIYFLKFMCEPATRNWWIFKQEQGTKYGELMTFRTWHQSANIDFVYNIHQNVYWKKNFKNVYL